jgi:riboflavin synthase
VFSGIVEEIGRVSEVRAGGRARTLRIEAATVMSDLSVGASIAVDGCCLTVVAHDAGAFEVETGAETLRRTTLGELEPGNRVNLERSLRIDARLGGHIVQGHVDGVGRLRSRRPEAGSQWVEFDAPAEVHRYLVEKGSVTVAGVSLTIAAVDEAGFAVSLIPHTLDATTLGELPDGAPVNLEADVLAKYVERLVTPYTRV